MAWTPSGPHRTSGPGRRHQNRRFSTQVKLAQARHDHFGEVPFRACRIHFDRGDQDILKAKGSPKAALNQELAPLLY